MQLPNANKPFYDADRVLTMAQCASSWNLDINYRHRTGNTERLGETELTWECKDTSYIADVGINRLRVTQREIVDTVRDSKPIKTKVYMIEVFYNGREEYTITIPAKEIQAIFDKAANKKTVRSLYRVA